MRPGAFTSACLLAVLLAIPAPSAPRQRVERVATVSADVDVEIYNVTGSVRVSGWDRSEVRVEGTLGEGVERLAFEHDGERVEIAVVVPRRRRRDSRPVVGDSHLRVMVPRNAAVEVDTLAASIEVEGVSGAVAMESSAGDVVYAGASRHLEADSAGGDIVLQCTAADAEVDVEGVAGGVLVELVGGTVNITTLTGGIRVIGGRIAAGDIESVSGAIYLEGEIAPGARLDFENFDGDIEMLVPSDTSAAFAISTYSGKIETEFGYQGRLVEAYSPEQVAAFNLGDGGAAVSIETFSGVVRVGRR